MAKYTKAFPIIPESVFRVHYIAGTLATLFTPKAWARRQAKLDKKYAVEVRQEISENRLDWTYQN